MQAPKKLHKHILCEILRIRSVRQMVSHNADHLWVQCLHEPPSRVVVTLRDPGVNLVLKGIGHAVGK